VAKVKIRLLHSLGGEFQGLNSPAAGTIVEVDADYAKAICKGDSPLAELVEEPKKRAKTEAASKAAPEAAMKPKAEARKG
jgi:hypothetical protein